MTGNSSTLGGKDHAGAINECPSYDPFYKLCYIILGQKPLCDLTPEQLVGVSVLKIQKQVIP